MDRKKSLNLLLGNKKQTLDKRGIQYEENNKIIILKPNTPGKKQVTCANKNRKNIKNLQLTYLYVEEMTS